jgi:protein O-GlcNAc transferase
MLHKLRSLFGLAQPTPAKTQETPDHLLEEGNRLLDQGRLVEAEARYRRASLQAPQKIEILVNLGFVLSELNQPMKALEVLQQIIQIAPHHSDAHYMIGTVALQNNNSTLAVEHFREALTERPDFEFALRDLTRLLLDDSKADEALAILHDCREKCPDSAEILFQIGQITQSLGEPSAATEWFSLALEKQPGHQQAMMGKVSTLHDQGRINDIKQVCTQWVSTLPQYPLAHYLLGNALKLDKRENEAIASWRRSVTLDPAWVDAWVAIGASCVHLRRWDEAIDSYQTALSLKPSDPNCILDLSFALDAIGRTDEAIAHLRHALQIKPDLITAHNNLAIYLAKMGHQEEAIRHLHKAVEQNPQDVALLQNLACQLNDSGHPETAIASLQKALVFDTSNPTTLSLLTFLASHSDNALPEEYLAHAKQFGKVATANATQPYCWSNDLVAVAPRKLRVGFVSGDLRNHPVGYFLESFLPHLDADRIEIFAYPSCPIENELSLRIKPCFSHWKSLVGFSDEAAAEIIHSDAIDVLIDLSGHTAYNRLTLFSWKAAPLQITWLGYWASTGVPEIDYLLADRGCLPPRLIEHFSEKIWYMPDTRMCATPLDTVLTAGPPPAQSNGYPSFGCYQHLAKISSSTLVAWGRIFAALPSARLRLQSKNLHEACYREEILLRLEHVGISQNRVSLHAGSSREKYLQSYAEVDILLDTFPFSGGTTTCEALWVGVPTLTLSGNRMVSRQGAGFLALCGQGQWIARDIDEYVSLAVKHAEQIEALAAIRKNLLTQARPSALFDGPRFATNFVVAIHAMWRDKWG